MNNLLDELMVLEDSFGMVCIREKTNTYGGERLLCEKEGEIVLYRSNHYIQSKFYLIGRKFRR